MAATSRSHHFEVSRGPALTVEEFEAMCRGESTGRGVQGSGQLMPDEMIREPVDMKAETRAKYAKYVGKWGPNFSRDLDIRDYKGWENTAGLVDAMLHFNKGARVLDLLSGPGRLGEKLKEYGFTNIDAIEGNPRMIEVARKRGVYKKVIECVVGLEDMGIDENEYDCVMTCGSFHIGNLDHTVLPDLAKIIKPGGFLVLNISKEAMENEEYLKGLMGTFHNLMDAGKFRFINMDKHSNYGCVDTVISAFKVLK